MNGEQQTPSDHTSPPSPGLVPPMPGELVVGASIDNANPLASETAEHAITPENGELSISIWNIIFQEPSKNRAVAPHCVFGLGSGWHPDESSLQHPHGSRNRWRLYRYGDAHPSKTLCDGCGGEVLPCPSCPPWGKPSPADELAASNSIRELAKNILDDMDSQTWKMACPRCGGNHMTCSNPSPNPNSEAVPALGFQDRKKDLVRCAICGSNIYPCPNCSTGPFSAEKVNKNEQNCSDNTKSTNRALASDFAGPSKANGSPKSKSPVKQRFNLRINTYYLQSFAARLMTRFQDKIYIFDQFIRIILWWKYISTPFAWQAVYAKVSSLLGDAPDLLADFSTFKPQSRRQVEEASANGEVPPPVHIDHVVELSEDNPSGDNINSQILRDNTAQQDQKYGVWKNVESVRLHARQSTEFFLCMFFAQMAEDPSGISKAVKICRGEDAEMERAENLKKPANLKRLWFLYQCLSTTAKYLESYEATQRPKFIVHLSSNHLESFMNELILKTPQAPLVYTLFFGIFLGWQGRTGLITIQKLDLALSNALKQFPDLESDWAIHIFCNIEFDSPEEEAEFNTALTTGGEFTTLLVVEADLICELKNINGDQGVLMLRQQEKNDSERTSHGEERTDPVPPVHAGGSSEGVIAATGAISNTEAAEQPDEIGKGTVVSHAERLLNAIDIAQSQLTHAEVTPPIAPELSPDALGKLESSNFNEECTMRGGGDICTICHAELTPDHECFSVKSKKERRKRRVNHKRNRRPNPTGSLRDEKWRDLIFEELELVMKSENGKESRPCLRRGSKKNLCNCGLVRTINQGKGRYLSQKKEKDVKMAGSALSSSATCSSEPEPVEHHSLICDEEGSRMSASQSSEADLICLDAGKCHWTTEIFCHYRHCTALYFRSESQSALSSSPELDHSNSSMEITTQHSLFTSLQKFDKEAPNSWNAAQLPRSRSAGSLESEISLLELTPFLAKMTIDAHDQWNQEKDDDSSHMQMDTKVSMRGGCLDEAEENNLPSGAQEGQLPVVPEPVLIVDIIGSTRERKTPRIPRSSMLSPNRQSALGLGLQKLQPQDRISLSQRLSAVDGKPMMFERPRPLPWMDLNNTMNRNPVTHLGDGLPVTCPGCSLTLWSPCPLCLPAATSDRDTVEIIEESAEPDEEVGCEECGANVLLPCPLCTVRPQQTATPRAEKRAAKRKRKKQLAMDATSAREGNGACLSVACQGKSGKLHGKAAGMKRDREWSCRWSWRYMGKVREGETIVVKS